MQEIDRELTDKINKELINDIFWVEDAEDIDEFIHEYCLDDRAICFTIPGHEFKCYGGDLYYILVNHGFEDFDVFDEAAANDEGVISIAPMIHIVVFKD